MLVNLKKLNESLEKTYLTESEELNETFSEMPKWLRDRILTVKKTNSYNLSDHQIGKKPSPDVGPKPSYSGRGYQYANDKAEKSLFNTLLNKGINLDTVEVIEGDIPTKNTDPRIKEPNIPIYLFDNGQVYVKGCNDQEEYRDFENKDGYKELRAFKYVPFKTLKEKAIKFAYIDGNKDSNFTVKEKRTERKTRQSEISSIRNYNRDKQNAGRDFWNSHIDKSGYTVIPSADRYEDQLNELKAGKVYESLDEFHDYLVQAKEELSYYFSNLDINDSDFASNNEDVFRNLWSTLTDAINEYKSILKDIKSLEDFNDEDKARNYLSRHIIGGYTWANLERNIKELKQKSDTVFNSIIDWI